MYTTNDDRDLLDLYIDELRGEPVLNAQQQKDLARQMRRAKNDAERERARSELIRANLRFAFSVAKQYQNRGVPLGDLVSEANAGLARAAEDGRFAAFVAFRRAAASASGTAIRRRSSAM